MSFSVQKLQLEPNVAIHATLSNPPKSSTKPTFVFLHYYGGSSKTWSQVIDRLCDDYHTVALDFRGWGDSTGPSADEAYSMKHLASDVEAVIKALALDNFTLAGLSMGAKVAQILAARDLPGLKSIVLVSPAPLTAYQLPPEMREQQIHAFDALETAAFVSRNVLTSSAVSEETVDALVADQLRGNEWARAAWPKYGMAEDYGALIESIKVPALVLAAANDIVETPERVKKEVYDKLPNAKWAVVSGSGHLSPVEKPEDVARVIRSFV